MVPHSLCHGFVYTLWRLVDPWTDWSCHPHYALSWISNDSQVASSRFQSLELNLKYRCRKTRTSPLSTMSRSTGDIGQLLCKTRVLGLSWHSSWMHSDAACTCYTQTLLLGSFVCWIGWVFHWPHSRAFFTPDVLIIGTPYLQSIDQGVWFELSPDLVLEHLALCFLFAV